MPTLNIYLFTYTNNHGQFIKGLLIMFCGLEKGKALEW